MHDMCIRTRKEDALHAVIPTHSVVLGAVIRHDLEDFPLARHFVDVAGVDNDLVSDASDHLHLLFSRFATRSMGLAAQATTETLVTFVGESPATGATDSEVVDKKPRERQPAFGDAD
jgi:hypothetical protein